MRFRCEQCSTEYSIPDEAVARATRARCPRCKHSQALSAGGVPGTTPPGIKQIGRVAITTLTVEPEPEPQPEPELFGELEWESESQLEFVVGRSHVQFDGIPPAPPSVPPVSPPSAAKSAPLQPSSSAPVEWNEATGEYPAGGDGRSPDPGATKADAWPETESSDPWKRTPLPPLQESLSPARPAGAPAARPPTPPAAAPPAPVSPITSGGHRRPPPPTPVPSSAPRPTSAAPSAPPARPAPASATPRQTGSTTAVSPTPAPAREPCAACGGKLTDADDLASGVCGACRARTAAALGRPLPTSAPTPTPLPSGPIPIELNTVDVAPRTPTPPPRPRRALRALPEPEHRGRVWMLLGALVVAAVISAALWYLRVRPDPGNLQGVADEVLPRTKKKPVAQGKLPEGLEARLASWKAPAEPRPVPDLLASARADLARDTEPSDLAAEKALETALLQESRNVEALGLWLEAIARGRGQQLAASDLAALIRLGESALEELGRQPPLEVGLASLLLVRGSGPDVERARSLGQAAVDASAPPPPAGARASQAPPPAPPASWGTRARLVLAEAYATSSTALALSLLQEVQQRDPAQRRVFNVRAAAHDAAGSPRAAVADLQGRLALDPDEPRTALALARLFGQVGETAPARRIYDRLQASPATQDGVAVIDMAALRAGPEHAPAEAVKLLSRAIQRGRLVGTDLLRAQVTLARLARAAGDLPAAAQAVTAALSAAPDDVLAHVQGLLVDLDRGAPEQAAAHLPAVLGHLGDAGLAALLEGRVRAAQQRWQAAAEAFERAAGADGRRTDARLWAGAAWAMTGSRERALQSANPAIQADPYRDGPGHPPLWPGDGLKGAADRLALLSKEDRDGQPLLAEAVLRVHQGDAAGAEALIDRILKAGGTQPVVIAWKSILLGAHGDSAGALARAQEAAAAGGRSSGFAQFALGSALLASGDVEGAQRALRDAQLHSPGLLAAQVRLAEAEARSGAIVSARERLQRVIVLDPEYASARRALYLLPPEG